MSTTKCICVWYDSVGTPGDPRWIVSVDEIDSATHDTLITDTIRILPADAVEADAVEAGKRIAVERDLPLYQHEFDAGGHGLGNRHTLLQGVDQ